MPVSTAHTRRQLDADAASAARSLPALLVEAERLSGSLMTGAHGRRRSGTGETFWQYRDYTINDPASAIDWRQSARSPRRLFVRETEWETAATVRFWCSGELSFDYASAVLPSKRRRAQVISLALAMALTRTGENIGTLPADRPARGGAAAVSSLAEHLLSQKKDENDPLPPIPPPGTTVAIFASDFYQPIDALLARMNAIGAAGVPAIVLEVTDPMERDFPFDGHTHFMPVSQERSFRFGDAKSIRQKYLEARTAHHDALRNAARRFAFPVYSHVTDQPPSIVLGSMHAALRGAMVLR